MAALALALAVVSACVASPSDEDDLDQAAAADEQTEPVATITTETEQGAMEVGEINSRAIPPGSYRQSCKSSSVRGSTLYSTCRRSNGKWHKTKLANYPECGADDIYNRDGNLGCVVPG
ncbi:MAG TPA: hypothetical protein VF469_36975 [Kofleriaceae bacterium]